MTRRKNKLVFIIKWALMIAAYGFLAYKLANIEYWEELRHSFSSLNTKRVIYLIVVLLMMPLNWAIETGKWQILTSKVVRLTFINALKGVLAGLNTGFVTPGRLGEFAGRVMYLPENTKWIGILLSLVNGFTQTLIITIVGLVSSYVYFSHFKSSNDYLPYLNFILGFFMVGIVLYFVFPSIITKLKRQSWAVKFRDTLKSLSQFDGKSLFLILFCSALRYSVFCVQYFFMLHFFNIEISAIEALVAIPTMYLFITYTPSLAASEAAIRGSLAVLILGIFSNNEIGILLTGILIWFINFILPMLAGSVLMIRSDSVSKS
ncbi:MAG: lysylphosphatidylglycerol synthase domain-containing protein [Paludibacteraceae bacterium]